jgi:hypothetical protein
VRRRVEHDLSLRLAALQVADDPLRQRHQVHVDRLQLHGLDARQRQQIIDEDRSCGAPTA